MYIHVACIRMRFPHSWMRVSFFVCVLYLFTFVLIYGVCALIGKGCSKLFDPTYVPGKLLCWIGPAQHFHSCGCPSGPWFMIVPFVGLFVFTYGLCGLFGLSFPSMYEICSRRMWTRLLNGGLVPHLTSRPPLAYLFDILRNITFKAIWMQKWRGARTTLFWANGCRGATSVWELRPRKIRFWGP